MRRLAVRKNRSRFCRCVTGFAFCFLLLVSARPVAAGVGAPASGPRFEELSLEQGLSQSIVACMIQDRNGFLWLGTEDGINIYNGYEFDVIRGDQNDSNSLSHNDVRSLLEDRNGHIWIGTFHGGLNRYDPVSRSFARYAHDPLQSQTLRHNAVSVLFEDSVGRFWVGTEGGLCLLDRGTSVFTDINDPLQSSDFAIWAIVEDGSDRIWAGSDRGLYLVDVGGRTLVPAGEHFPWMTIPEDVAVQAIMIDRDQRIWIGTRGQGAWVLSPEKQREVRFGTAAASAHRLSHDDILALYEDKFGDVWIGTNGGGVNRVSRDSSRIDFFRSSPADPDSPSFDEITCILEDRAGVLWLGTYGGGVNRVSGRHAPFVHYPFEPGRQNSLSHEIVWSMCEDRDGNLWIGTHGGGLDCLDRSTGTYRHYRHDPDDPTSLSHNIVRLVMVAADGRVWAGTHGGGISVLDPAAGRFTRYRHDPANPGSLSHDSLRALYQDPDGTIWVGTYGGGLCRYNADTDDFTAFRYDPHDDTSISNDIVRCIIRDSRGYLWVGTQGGGLNRLDPETGVFQTYRNDPERSDSLCNDSIFSLHEDAGGTLWIGTWGGGLCRYHPDSDRFDSLTMADGLPNNSIYGILEDDAGRLWLSTNRGLSRYDPETGSFRNFDVRDGLQSNEFNGGSYFRSPSGEMFFGGINGFNSFFPSDIRDNRHVPPVMITGISVLNRKLHTEVPVHAVRELTLDYRDYVVSFQFSALDFTIPEKNRYAYQMVGVDDDWVYTDASRRHATYTTLDPGEYTFRVKGSNNDGVWNETGREILVNVLPPFWKTWWFRTIIGLMVLFLVTVMFRMKVRSVRMATVWQAARNAQMSIMPQEDPDVPGLDVSGICVPAHQVGGDFFDYFSCTCDDGVFGVAVGDVSGKAMDSAMIAVLSSGMLCARLQDGARVEDVLNQLNGPMYRKTEKRMFTAICLAVLDTVAGVFTFANAGLNEPIHVRDGRVAALGGVGSRLPLGVQSDNRYQQRAVSLEPGDVVVLCTDGITEARNSAGDFYTEQRLRVLLAELDTLTLSAFHIRQAIMEHVQRFTRGAIQHDDMTVVVLKYTG